jgi:APA family basic amino acid/polyamine antiporter
MATALVVGNMISASVFLLPAALAPYGLNSLPAWGISITGALLVASVYAALGRAFPDACGPYDYTRLAFGEFAGFLVAWGYWISCWVGNGAIATGAVSYLSEFTPAITVQPLAAAVTMAAIVVLTGVNVYGTRIAGSVQLFTTGLKLVPLLVIGVLGLTLLATHGPGVVRHLAAAAPLRAEAITAAATLTLFALLGLESATVPAGKVADPRRTIPRATLLGTALTAVIYVASCSTALIVLPSEVLAQSHAPFADVVRRSFGETAAAWLAVFAVVSGFGALNGWILIQGEVPYHMARRGVFPRLFARQTSRGTPGVSLLVGGGLTCGVIAVNASKSMSEVFRFVVLLSTAATLVMYFACSLAALKLLRRDRLVGVSRRRLVVVAVLAAAYSLWTIVGAGLSTDPAACEHRALCWAPWSANPAILCLLLLASGVPVFWLMRRRPSQALVAR